MTNPNVLKMTSLLLMLALGASLIAGCSTGEETTADTGIEIPEAAPAAMKFGTLATEDALPLWVAQEKGYLAEEGLPAFEVVVFPSAQERDAAFASGAVDAFAGDLTASISLEAAGTGVTLATVMLGAAPAQTVLAVADAFMREEGGTQAVDAMLEAWDRAVTDINAAPAEFRPLLVEKAQLPESSEAGFAIATYPAHALPTKTDIDAVLTSMKASGQLKGEVTYEDLTLVMPE